MGILLLNRSYRVKSSFTYFVTFKLCQYTDALVWEPFWYTRFNIYVFLYLCTLRNRNKKEVLSGKVYDGQSDQYKPFIGLLPSWIARDISRTRIRYVSTTKVIKCDIWFFFFVKWMPHSYQWNYYRNTVHWYHLIILNHFDYENITQLFLLIIN